MGVTIRWLVCSAAALGLVGCVVPSLPTEVGSLPVEPAAQWTAVGPDEIEAFEHGWLSEFGDPVLVELVGEAQRHNYDLRATAARLDAFRAGTIIAASDLYPQLSGGLDAGRSMRSSKVMGETVRTRTWSHTLDLAVSWEVDIWGRLRDRSQAALADFEATGAEYRGARLSLAAQVASAWYDAVEAEMQVRLAEQTVESFEQSLRLVDERQQRGLTTALDVHLARTNVAGARSTLEFRRRQRDAAVRALEVLLGRYPSHELALNNELPRLDEPVPAGLPSGLLRRRPDLLAAERDLAATGARVREAEKNLLPSIRLTGGAGTSSDELEDLLNSNFGFWNVAGSLAQPLFQGLRLAAGVEQSEADRAAALAVYAQTALLAFQEVESALAAEGYLADEEAAIEMLVRESAAAERVSAEEYNLGLVEYINVLESQRRAFNSRQQLISIANQRLQNRIALYLALGGEFAPHAESAPGAGGAGADDDDERGDREGDRRGGLSKVQ